VALPNPAPGAESEEDLPAQNGSRQPDPSASQAPVILRSPIGGADYSVLFHMTDTMAST
jgi:hypothetical protein